MSCILFRIGEHCEDAMAHKLLDKHAKKSYIEVLLDQSPQQTPTTDLT